ncbi:hypothetical protein KUTeg_001600 [Tegillarca granosa]|uniref:Cell division control protein n=1 Tax=Tegillarca granosa TaxID=220873 RepID=A0ABQ9FRX2_TEGGR|nr:hypothetical protein KUTeg_001600 [Tegillarca granosa]
MDLNQFGFTGPSTKKLKTETERKEKGIWTETFKKISDTMNPDEENVPSKPVCSPNKIKRDNTPSRRRAETPIQKKGPRSKLVYNVENNDENEAKIHLSPLRVKPMTPGKENTPKKSKAMTSSPYTEGIRQNRTIAPLSPIKLSSLNDLNKQSPIKDKPKKESPSLKLQKPDSQAYHRAKQCLHTAKPDRLVGRENELNEINSFVKNHLSNKTAGSLYISGAPGTGKTAVLTYTLDNVKASHSCKTVYLNCMTLKDPATVYGKLYTDITGKCPPSAKDRLRAVEKCLSASGPSIIMVLDEIDQLDSKNQEILYTIFEWPALTKSRLILIGIANALDLTDRVLPRLQARPKCKPILLNFAPYSKDQIAAIIKDRLKNLEKEGLVVMEESAVIFCARKISAVAGDMRKALDVCHRAVSLVETEVRSQKILTSSDAKSPLKQAPSLKRIGVMQISKVLSEVYGSSSSTNTQDSIPLQQKLVVCTLLLMVKLGKMKEVTLGKLHETYSKVCRKRQIAAVDFSEYQGICTLLETRGIMAIKKAKEVRISKLL